VFRREEQQEDTISPNQQRRNALRESKGFANTVKNQLSVGIIRGLLITM
jgi:hypothetical protein